MSWVLGIDTSSTELSMGLVKDGEPFITCSRYVRHSHAEHITQIVTFILETSGINATDIERAGISVGPGSFTGLRIGISFLKGFFLTLQTPILPISSLAIMAASLPENNKTMVTAMDARQNRVFYSRFKHVKGRLERLTEDTLVPLDAFVDQLDVQEVLIIDTLGYRKSTVFDFAHERQNVYFTNKLALNRGLSCARMAVALPECDTTWKKVIDITPNYMQDTYAKKIKEKNRG